MAEEQSVPAREPNPSKPGISATEHLGLTCPPKTGPGVKLDLGWMKGGEMPTKRHTPEQVINKLREAEVAMAQGSTVGEASRQIGVTEQTLRLRSGQALLPVAQ